MRTLLYFAGLFTASIGIGATFGVGVGFMLMGVGIMSYAVIEK